MFVFALMLPFVVTEGVAADYKRRVHELLMATPLPGWAYVWGVGVLCAMTLRAQGTQPVSGQKSAVSDTAGLRSSTG